MIYRFKTVKITFTIIIVLSVIVTASLLSPRLVTRRQHKDCLSFAQAEYFGDDLVSPRTVPAEFPLVENSWPRTPANQSYFYESWNRPFTTRFKVLNGTVYIDAKAGTYFGPEYVNTFGEMLVVASWLYQLPDMDLVYSSDDVPHIESQTEFPVISTCLGLNDILSDHGRFSMGYTVPHFLQWARYSMSSNQLLAFMQCLDAEYPWERKEAKVFWRGSSTGRLRGWDSPAWNTHHNVSWTPEEALANLDFAEKLAHNRRISASLMSFNYPWMDVGITHIHDYDFHNPGRLTEVNSQLEVFNKLVVRPGLPLEQWNNYLVNLHIHGHGFTDRLPFMLLSNTPLLAVKSHIKEWYHSFFKEGEHFLTASGDLHDLLYVAKQMLDRLRNGDKELRHMVARRQEISRQKFNTIAILDAFAWAVTQAWSWCNWKPDMQEGFEVFKVPKLNNNLPPYIWKTIKKTRPEQF
ncbi:hypothetical protein VOLCADRAFT_87420 [Volvox carteri f. nagariensis]|uniref:Uncharacterized protein n=1 Tax=Volvox carteri f. nagariensis TaxID=3068 RepID=D8TLA8_VOLCA|nr:uncharacterized protein VOLCADRAFT_87420 [Volvox carteri f. nagariensis]EFJ51704.1 hypothetical protein VOLCADRAFT_87420 [Volvox carteri f. nagariensis]|eukprot:XP_002947114.1 hypothetical protein VOLCADRAFT_87420 [Volvox carteri f. nagariensis]